MMTISTAISLLSALIGSVATLMAAWGYLRTHRPPRGELLRTGATVTVIMVGIFSIAMLISNFTSIQINGQKNVPVPPVFTSHYWNAAPTKTPTKTPTSSPTAKPTKTSTPVSTPTPQLTPMPSPGQEAQQTPVSSPVQGAQSTQTSSTSTTSTTITPVATP